MKKYNLYTYIFSILICLISNFDTFSSNHNLAIPIHEDSMNVNNQQQVIDAYVQAGDEELAKIIAQNTLNDLKGESQNNNYIIGFEQVSKILALTADKFLAQYNPRITNATALNAHLVTLNTELRSMNKPLIYVGVDALLGDILSKLSVTGVQTTAKMEQVTIQKQDFATFGTINNVYLTIYDRVGNHLPDLETSHPNGMIIIGYGIFRKYTINGEVDPSKITPEEIRKLSELVEWQYCNFKEKITTTLSPGTTAFRALVFQDFSQFAKSTSEENVLEHLTDFSTQIKKSLLGQKTYTPKGLFYDDCYSTTGSYKSNLDADVTTEQVEKVNALVLEMMDNALYASYIKVSLDTKTVGGGKIKQIDLINMEKALISLRSACQTTYNQTSAAYVTKLISFLTQCSSFVYEPCEVTTYVPRCFWDSPASLPPGVSVADIPVCAGIIDGAIETVWGVLQLGGLFQKLQFDLATEAACMIPGATLLTDGCIEKREKFKSYFDVLSDIPKAWDNVVNISSQISSKLGSEYKVWLGEITSLDNCGRYRQGRALFDVASLFVGAGEFKLATKGFSVMQTLEKFALKATQTVSKITVQATTKAAGVALKKVTVTLANKSRTAAMAVVWGAATSLPNTYIHILPKATAAMEWASSKISSLARPIAEASTNMGDEMVGRVLIGETSLEASVASEIASATSREVFSTVKVGTLETVKDLANATQRPAKTIALGAGESIESSVITTVSGTEYIAVEVVNNSSAVRKLIAASVLVGNTFSKLQPKKEEATESSCQVCATRLTNSAADQALCTKLTNLASKSRTHGTFAVNKLCANIINTATLESVVNEVLTFTQPEAEAFLADINGSTCTGNHLCSIANIQQIDVSIVNAWKYIVDAMNTGTRRTAFAQDFPLINKVKEITTTPTKLNAFTNPTFRINSLPRFLNIYNVVDCNTCGPVTGIPTWMPKMDEILENSLDAQSKYINSSGYAPVGRSDGFARTEPFNDGSGNSIYSRDGGQHMLRGMKTGLTLSGGRTLTFTPTLIQAFDEPFGATNNPNYPLKQCDLRLGTNTANVVFVEFKSYQETTNLGSSGVEQFLGYLSDTRVQNLNNLVYVFNAKKTTTELAAKTIMQTVFQGAKANDIFNIIYVKMAVSLGLDLTSRTLARQQYNTLITNLDDKIFGFVIIN